MFKKVMKKVTCGVLALTSVVACAGTLTACETSHPEVEMTVSFNGKDYVLEYKLYRKLAPNTVNHFIWLAENGYYDGVCVHDYNEDSLRMYTGAYEVADSDSDDDGLVYKAYYDFAKEHADSFPASVWGDEGKTDPTYTLYGEFESNSFRVENGALKEKFGSLTMYYYAKDTSHKVWTARADSEDEVSKRYYKYNSTTSMFYISMTETETTNNDYCTFATLEEDGVEELKELMEAIDEYIDATYGEEDDEEFTEQKTVRVDEDDAIVGEVTTNKKFNVPNKAIVIKSVKVTKF